MDRVSATETHISVLVFVGDRVYKARKPVRTPFLDFSTRALRQADCRREVALNRRLAPDVYLGVLDVVDEQGDPVDHVVVMRRLPDHRRLSALICAEDFDERQLLQVARRLAAFHEAAERSPEIEHAGSVEHLTMLWTTNLDETEQYRGGLLDAGAHARVRRLALEYLDGRHGLLARRVAQGRIVDGHGDLLAEDIFCLDDGPRILDCIQFDPTFRYGDVLYDTAFLAMDLEHLGRPDLARRFLDAYREHTAETHPSSLEHWYIAYRALVRAKIACLRADGGDPWARAEAAAFLAQAARHLDDAQVHLVLVGGLPGAGKSTVAAGVAEHLDWDLLRSDLVRRELAGDQPLRHRYARPFEGQYAPGSTDRVYDEVLRRARVALENGDSIVLDASWLDPAHRAAARGLAQQTRSRMVELCCVLDPLVAEERIRARAAHGTDPSDATPEVLAAFVARVPEVPWAGARVVDTSERPEVAVARAVGQVRPSRVRADSTPRASSSPPGR